MNIKIKLLTGLIFMTAMATSQATVIDFQDISPASTIHCDFVGFSVNSQGFHFTGNPAVNRGNLYTCGPNVLQHNTTPALLNANFASIITMTEKNGNIFSLQSFFAGGRTKANAPNSAVTTPYTVAKSINILGNFTGGGTVLFSVTLDSIAPYAWTQYVLPTSFTNLLSVTLTAQGGLYPEFLIDDIVVNIPEPNFMELIAFGLTSLIVMRKHRFINV
jgi:hypothetical protein